MTNREILFVVKLRNDARRAIQGLTGDLRRVAKAAGTAAAGNNAHAKSLKGVAAQAQVAAQAVQQLNQAQGGAVNPINRGIKGWQGWVGALKHAIQSTLIFTAAYMALGALFAGATGLVEQGAQWQMMNARIQLVTSSIAEANYVQEQLFNLAQKNTAEMEGTVTLFYRTARAVTDYGYSLNDVLKITDAVQQAMIVSGATTTEATGAMIQFSQALSSNRLGGEEFRSVMENAPRLAQAILDGIKKDAPELAGKYGLLVNKKVEDMTTQQRELMAGSLRAMALDGLLTTDLVAKSVLASAAKINEEYLKLPMTASRALVVMKNAVLRESGEIDKALNLNGGISAAVLFLSNDVIPRLSDLLEPVGTMLEVMGFALGSIRDALTGIGAMIGVTGSDMGNALTVALKAAVSLLLALGAFRGMVGVMRLTASGIGLLVPAFAAARTAGLGFFAAMRAAIMANPILAAISLLLAAFMTFRNATITIGEDTASVGAIIAEAWERVGNVVASIWQDIVSVAMPVINAIGEGWTIMCNWLHEVWVKISSAVASLFGWVAEKAQEYLGGALQFFAQIPGWYAAIVRGVFDTLASFFKATVDMAASAAGALDIFGYGWEASMKSFSAAGSDAIRTFGNDIGDFYEGMPKMIANAGAGIGEALGEGAINALKYSPVGAVAGLVGYLGGKIRDEFGDGTFMSDAAKRTDAEQGRQGDINLDNGNGNQLVNEDDAAKADKAKKEREKADKAAKERAKRIKEAVSDLNSLTAAYSPYLDALRKDAESHQMLDGLLAMQKTRKDEFAEALTQAGLSLEQFGQLAWQVQNNLKVDTAREFFGEFIENYDLYNEKTTEAREKSRQFSEALEAAANVGGAQYEEFLRQAGISADAAAAAIARFKAGLSEAEIQTRADAIANLASRTLGYSSRLMETAEQQRELVRLENLRTVNMAAFDEALKRLGLSQADFNLALERQRIIMDDTDDVMAQGRRAAQLYVIDLEDSGMRVADVWKNAFSGMENAMASFVATGKLDFKGLVDSIIADLARLLVQQTIMKGITTAFGLPFGVGHSGGLAGAGDTRPVHPAVFAGAKRFHVGGLASGPSIGLRKDEVPVVAKRNEALLPTTRLPDGNFGVKALIPEDMRGGRGGAGTGSSIVIAPNITNHIQGGDDPDAMGKNVSEYTVKALEALVQRVIKDEMRSGGVLSGA